MMHTSLGTVSLISLEKFASLVPVDMLKDNMQNVAFSYGCTKAEWPLDVMKSVLIHEIAKQLRDALELKVTFAIKEIKQEHIELLILEGELDYLRGPAYFVLLDSRLVLASPQNFIFYFSRDLNENVMRGKVICTNSNNVKIAKFETISKSVLEMLA